MIKYDFGTDITEYFDKHNNRINAYDSIIIDGKVRTVYPTENGLLGLDATNPLWVKTGRAVPCEYGLYPLTEEETNNCELTEAQDEYLQDAILTENATGLVDEEQFVIGESTLDVLRKYLKERVNLNNDEEVLNLLEKLSVLKKMNTH